MKYNRKVVYLSDEEIQQREEKIKNMGKEQVEKNTHKMYRDLIDKMSFITGYHIKSGEDAELKVLDIILNHWEELGKLVDGD